MTTGIDAIARSGSIFGIPVESGAMAACAAFGGLSADRPDKFSHTGQPKRRRKKCRTFHPALCTVETGSRQSLVRSLYSAASPDAACVAAAAASAPAFSSGCGHDTASQLIAVGRYDIVAGLHGTHEGVETALRALHRVVDDGLQAA